MPPKSPRIELSNDRGLYVCRTKMSSFRIRIGNISPSATQWHFPLWKWRRKNPQNLPFPLHDVDPHLIQQCLSPPHAPPQTAAPTVEALSHTYAGRRKVLIGYNGVPQIRRQEYPLPWTDRQTPLPASSLDPSDRCYQTASGSDAPFFHNALDRPTDRPTDRQNVRGKFDDYRRLRSESDAA